MTEIQVLQHRVERLEKGFVPLQSMVGQPSAEPWWQRIAGQFENDATFDEIVRLGRESQQPEVEE